MKKKTCCDELFALQYKGDDGVWHLYTIDWEGNPLPVTSSVYGNVDALRIHLMAQGGQAFRVTPYVLLSSNQEELKDAS